MISHLQLSSLMKLMQLVQRGESMNISDEKSYFSSSFFFNYQIFLAGMMLTQVVNVKSRGPCWNC